MININGNAAAIEIICSGLRPPAIKRPAAIRDCTIPIGYSWMIGS